ncbi:MAG TPA: NAD-binding protein [Acidimicrobiales bacterium]|nr:NAD-binding protein [Acidimicrobiales bacterium]
MEAWRRVRLGLVAFVVVTAVGSGGYVLLGFSPLNAVYQTVTTLATVGFREVEPLDAVGKIYTMVLILVGVGTVLTTFTVVVEALIEGSLRDVYGRRRMDRKIAGMAGHVIVCGWGRVGQSIARYCASADQPVVVVDIDADRLADIPHPHLIGDATDDAVLRDAGIGRARSLVAAIDTDAENLFVALSGRNLRPDLFIVARARTLSSEEKLLRAGADRVVNPQAIGGERIAALLLQPHVAEFVDVVMHDGSLEFRLEEVPLPEASPLVGRTIRDSHVRDTTGALVLALRTADGSFLTNPDPSTVLRGGQILIVVGTGTQTSALRALVLGRSRA